MRSPAAAFLGLCLSAGCTTAGPTEASALDAAGSGPVDVASEATDVAEDVAAATTEVIADVGSTAALGVDWWSEKASVVASLHVAGAGLAEQFEYLRTTYGVDAAAAIQGDIDRGHDRAGFIVSEQRVTEVRLLDGNANPMDDLGGDGFFAVAARTFESGGSVPRLQFVVLSRDDDSVAGLGSVSLRLPIGQLEAFVDVTEASLAGGLGPDGALREATITGGLSGANLARGLSETALRCPCLGLTGPAATWNGTTLECAPELQSGGCGAADTPTCGDLTFYCAAAAETFIPTGEGALPVTLELLLVPATIERPHPR